MGWSYVLAIVSTAIAIFCPVLSNYTDIQIKEEKLQKAQNDSEIATKESKFFTV